MYKKLLIIIIFILTLLFINFNFKISNYQKLNILSKENNFYLVINEEILDNIINKTEFYYKDKKYRLEILNIDKNLFNNQVILTLKLKTNLKYIENNIYKVNNLFSCYSYFVFDYFSKCIDVCIQRYVFLLQILFFYVKKK